MIHWESVLFLCVHCVHGIQSKAVFPSLGVVTLLQSTGNNSLLKEVATGGDGGTALPGS